MVLRRVEQQVARQAHNLKVAGSNPASATFYRFLRVRLPRREKHLPLRRMLRAIAARSTRFGLLLFACARPIPPAMVLRRVEQQVARQAHNLKVAGSNPASATFYRFLRVRLPRREKHLPLRRMLRAIAARSTRFGLLLFACARPIPRFTFCQTLSVINCCEF